MKLVEKYRKLDRKEKAQLTTSISLIGNMSLALVKFILAVFKGVFFFVAGCINVFFFIAKLECFKGLRKNDNTYKFKNKVVSIFLILAGLMYALYMSSLIFSKREVMDYTDVLAILVALIAFVEMGFAIAGLINQNKHGHYYRNLKIINFSSTLTSMIWCMLALLIYCDQDYQLICGISGLCVGVVIVILGIYLLFAPKVSIVDREYNEYLIKDKDFNMNSPIILSKSFILGDYYYEFTVSDNTVKGYIKRGRNFFSKINIYWKIFIIVLSEILIFYYFILKFIYFFKTIDLPTKLDKIMLEKGCEKNKF